ncbi:hypothetical protein LINPERHAP2_LOCUS13726 [Linum perenne]
MLASLGLGLSSPLDCSIGTSAISLHFTSFIIVICFCIYPSFIRIVTLVSFRDCATAFLFINSSEEALSSILLLQIQSH